MYFQGVLRVNFKYIILCIIPALFQVFVAVIGWKGSEKFHTIDGSILSLWNVELNVISIIFVLLLY